MTAREYIVSVLKRYPVRGWRRLKRRWANRRKRIFRWGKLKEFAYDKYRKALRRGHKVRAGIWLRRHRGAKKKYRYLVAQKAAAEASGYDAGSHTSAWDGRRVAAWMRGDEPGPNGNKIDWLQKIEDAGWDGQLYSGWRSPEYSESLCYNICGAPSCSGLCAGRASNHSQTGPPNWGAIDVANWSQFAACNAKVNGPFKNNLPYDRPHRSYTGN